MEKVESFFKIIKDVVLKGDISLVLLLSGLRSFLWAFFSIFELKTIENFKASINHFPIYFPEFWIINYLICGILMWVVVGLRYPPVLSLLLGTWCIILWSWSIFGNLTNISLFQMGSATSIVYIIVGLLLIQRTSKSRAV